MSMRCEWPAVVSRWLGLAFWRAVISISLCSTLSQLFYIRINICFVMASTSTCDVFKYVTYRQAMQLCTRLLWVNSFCYVNSFVCSCHVLGGIGLVFVMKNVNHLFAFVCICTNSLFYIRINICFVRASKSTCDVLNYVTYRQAMQLCTRLLWVNSFCYVNCFVFMPCVGLHFACFC
jgi:hypothetical protein